MAPFVGAWVKDDNKPKEEASTQCRPPFTFFVPPSHGIRDHALGPGTNKVGRCAAAAEARARTRPNTPISVFVPPLSQVFSSFEPRPGLRLLDRRFVRVAFAGTTKFCINSGSSQCAVYLWPNATKASVKSASSCRHKKV
jgi:hypothetical protein